LASSPPSRSRTPWARISKPSDVGESVTTEEVQPKTRQYPLYGATSPANLMTIGRIILSPWLFWMIISNRDSGGTSWLLFFVSIVFGATDFLDGYVARWTNSVGRLGAFLDPLADKIVVLGAAISYVWIGRYWWVPVALMAAREVAVSLMRVRFAAEGLAMPARNSGKWKAGFQAIALLMAAAPVLEDHTTLVRAALWFAVAFTTYTGWQYFNDGRAATRTTGVR